MILTPANKKDYQKTSARIDTLADRLNADKLAAFEKHGHATADQVKAAFARSSGPDLGIVYLGVDLDGQINQGTGKPEINEILVKAFEKGVITGEQLDRLVEHEFTHWFERAWAQANPTAMRSHFDVGKKYEGDVYGTPWTPDYKVICPKVYGGKCHP